MDMKKAVVLLGLPLSGKSTWIKEQTRLQKYKVISADTIKEEHPDYDPNDTEPLHNWSVLEAELEMVQLAKYKKSDVVFDSSSINNSYTVRIITMLKESGYTIELVHIKTPYFICLERGKSRERKVPEAEIIKKAIKETKQFHRLSKLVDEVTVVDYFTNKHIFVDMDGVIAALSTLPIINGEIDFVNGEVHKHLRPVTPIIDKLWDLRRVGHELYILSAIPNSFSLNEKNDWLDKYFNIPTDRRFFVNQGRHKSEMLGNLSLHLKIDKKDMVMIDDIHDTLYAVKKRGINCMHVSEFLIHEFDN